MYIEMQQKCNVHLISKNTWELVDFPIDRKAVKCKWVFNKNFCKDGCVGAKRCNQIFGVDFKVTLGQ